NWDGSEAWLITRYHDVRAAFSDPRLSSDPSKPGYPEKNAAFKAVIGQDRNLRTMDPPEHGMHKRMIVRDFTVKRVEDLRPRIQTRVDELIDEMLAKGPPSDLVTDLAFPVPTMVICELLGVPYADRDFFAGRAYTCFSSEASPEVAAVAGQELYDYTDALLTAKDKDPQNDLLSRLVVEQLRPGTLSRKDVVELARFILIAGHETTANTIAVSMLALFQNPDQLADLRGDPSLIENAVDELLRYTSTPHLGRRRVATADIEIGGQIIRAGEGVIIANNVADRDDSVMHDAGRLDLRRPNARANLAFGYGPHQCLGQLLSRVELQLVFATLCRRMPTLKLAVPFAEIQFKEHDTVYGLRSLPVSWA
ncbi:MAG TPA: cytochrome P450, partial [Bosea sp. (in: a-proteobacteria)]|nr:cytochrome P450 [Bosea sp. (in: a-proteobacteria)]